ncbi:HAMP domain-containing sensor histidine kinase [uncultured Aquabacterium sp.]|uniref:sensor histidine kinase n=1 Tax=Aquabacterium sp. TaxID=1872578 RepID=UPI0025E95192|nr:HAMP domain-containing sensor histidine kinase [uncultured Aquabacterium sp.]
MPEVDTRTLAARRLAPLALMLAVGSMLLLLQDGAAGLNTPWESRFGPILSTLYGLASILLWWRPHRIDVIVGGTLGCTGFYFLGCLYEGARLDSAQGLYAVGANAQFMPLLYVAAFIALRRSALWVSAAMYAALLGLYGWLYRDVVQAGGTYQQLSGHVWTVLLLVNPVCILALQYITALRGRLQRAEREAHEGKERFLAMLSHEIRSPLQSMLGSIDLLAMRLHDDAGQRAVDRLRRAATQLEAHLRDITEYTRLESPDWQLHEEDTDVAQLVQDVCDQMAPLAEHKRLALYCRLPDATTEAPPLGMQRLDPVRVRQILLNLLSNAIKYTPDGEITVRATLHPALPRPALLQLEVEDTGIGIDPSQRHRIFEPHVRLEDPRSDRVGGSGLGLAVVQRLVERLGGHIDVDSQPAQGTRFTVTLPLSPPAASQRQFPLSSPAPHRP